jgi:hypothetical protein
MSAVETDVASLYVGIRVILRSQRNEGDVQRMRIGRWNASVPSEQWTRKKRYCSKRGYALRTPVAGDAPGVAFVFSIRAQVR